MDQRMAHVVREEWNISYLHSYGRIGSALVDSLASGEPAGNVIAFSSLKPARDRTDWSVVACIDLGQSGTIFGRVVADKPWTARTIRSRMRIGQRVKPVALEQDVPSLARIAFVLID